jgi:hypothetical protein
MTALTAGADSADNVPTARQHGEIIGGLRRRMPEIKLVASPGLLARRRL